MSIPVSPIAPELGYIDEDDWLHELSAETKEKRKLSVAKSFESMKDTAVFDEAEITRFVESKLARRTHSVHLNNISSNLIYQPLTDDQEIRVLEIHPGSGPCKIEGTLHHCSIEFTYPLYRVPNTTLRSTLRSAHAVSLTKKRALWYTALSYVWGPPVFTSTILCNGKKFSITPDLETALRRLRETDEPIFLWVDQICINQKDNEEKSKQVQLMDNVYQRAFSTVIWLGSDPGGAELALHALRTAREYLQLTELHVTISDNSESFGIQGITLEAWEAVRKMFTSPWFERLWVIQEATVSSNSHVIYGPATLPWDDFDAACWELADRNIDTWLERTDQKGIPFKNNFGIRAVVEMGRLGFRYHSTAPDAASGSDWLWLSVLVSTRYAKAMDPRDKVYGTLGICRMPVPVDYTKTVEDIYYETTLLILREQVRELYTFMRTKKVGELMKFHWHSVYQVLCCIDHEPQVSRLPSWTVDWSKPRYTQSLGYSTFSGHLYHASDHKRFENGIFEPVVIDEDRKCLKISGQIIDAIERLTGVDSTGIISDENPSENNKHLREAVGLVKSCAPYPSGDLLFEAFWKTLVAGKDGSESQRCPPEYAQVFSLLLDETTGQYPSLPDQTYSPRQQKGRFSLENLKTRSAGKTFRDLQKAYATAMTNRRVCVTQKNYIGIVPRYSRKEDYICVFAGCHVPFVIRKHDKKYFELLGECYIHGLMEGEAMGMEGKVDGCDMRTIELA